MFCRSNPTFHCSHNITFEYRSYAIHTYVSVDLYRYMMVVEECIYVLYPVCVNMYFSMFHFYIFFCVSISEQFFLAVCLTMSSNFCHNISTSSLVFIYISVILLARYVLAHVTTYIHISIKESAQQAQVVLFISFSKQQKK